MPKKNFDFAGYVTRDNVRCTDGTVIRHGCFREMNGKTVPLVWQHQHDSVGEVLGHAELEERPDGLYCYAYCNNTPAGQNAKECVRHGDINAFSIWANNLKRGARDARDIVHGIIREVSLVFSGADKTAIVDAIAHSGQTLDEIDEAFTNGEGEAELQFLGGYGELEMGDDYLSHEDDDDEEETEDENMGGEEITNDDPSVEEVLDTFDDDQRTVLEYLVGRAAEEVANSMDESDDYDEDDYDDDVDDEDDSDEDDYDDDEDSDEDEDDDYDDYDDSDDDGDYGDDGGDGSVAHADAAAQQTTVGDILDTFTDEQRMVLNYLIGRAIEKAKGNGSDEDDEEDDNVAHNAFEEYGEDYAPVMMDDYISHEDLEGLIHDAKTVGGGSLREAYQSAVDNGIIAHADNGLTAGEDYGITNVEYLFPEARSISDKPDFVSRNMDWVDGVLSAVHKTPFARVKSMHANITADEARARGYIKGKYKKEEVFSLLKRATYPQTIYKKQRMDKDDIDDITEFDVIVWLKGEMQIMLREELARAILIGDGRDKADDDKILPDHIRPVVSDDDFYSIKYAVEVPANASDDQKAKALLKAQLKARKLYKGSGNLTFYTKEDELTNVLLLENGIGERIYKSEAEVATAMRVKSVVPVEPMEGLKVSIDDGKGNATSYDVAGIDVNLADYNIGTNGGAKTDFFDDFDLNYNQQIVLYETRLSGALVKPFSAIVFYYKSTGDSTGSSTGSDTGSSTVNP